MRHLEEIKIGFTAATFCIIMLLCYAIIPQGPLTPTRTAPMPKVPTEEDWDPEEDYSFEIYTQESNYDDWEDETTAGDSAASQPDIPEETYPPVQQEPVYTPEPVLPDDTGSGETILPEEEIPVEGDPGNEPDTPEIPSEDYQDEDILWNESSEVFYYE